MRVGFLLSIALFAACGGDRKRPPLEEVPIDNGSHQSTADVPTTSSPSATASSTTPPPDENAAARAKTLLQKGDRAGARAILEPRVDDKSATPEEKQLLKGICKAAHDMKCLAKLK
jgi:hypothetical protein